MEIIQNPLGLFKSQTTTEDRVNASTVENIVEDEIMTCLIMNTTSFIIGQGGPESLSLEIYNDIFIPNIVGTNKEK